MIIKCLNVCCQTEIEEWVKDVVDKERVKDGNRMKLESVHFGER